jgi:hypothetical protein
VPLVQSTRPGLQALRGFNKVALEAVVQASLR